MQRVDHLKDKIDDRGLVLKAQARVVETKEIISICHSILLSQFWLLNSQFAYGGTLFCVNEL